MDARDSTGRKISLLNESSDTNMADDTAFAGAGDWANEETFGVATGANNMPLGGTFTNFDGDWTNPPSDQAPELTAESLEYAFQANLLRSFGKSKTQGKRPAGAPSPLLPSTGSSPAAGSSAADSSPAGSSQQLGYPDPSFPAGIPPARWHPPGSPYLVYPVPRPEDIPRDWVQAEPPRPKITVVFVPGKLAEVALAATLRFAYTFKFYHLWVEAYVEKNLRGREVKDPALGGLDPVGLEEFRREGVAIPSPSLVEILLYKIDMEIARGRRQFIITGIEEDTELLRRFEDKVSASKNANRVYGANTDSYKISKVTAILFFMKTGEKATESSDDVAREFKGAKLLTFLEDNVEATWDDMLAEIYSHVVEGSPSE